MEEGNEFSDRKFWKKLKKYAKLMGRELLERALIMYYVSRAPTTPLMLSQTLLSLLDLRMMRAHWLLCSCSAMRT